MGGGDGLRVAALGLQLRPPLLLHSCTRGETGGGRQPAGGLTGEDELLEGGDLEDAGDVEDAAGVEGGAQVELARVEEVEDDLQTRRRHVVQRHCRGSGAGEAGEEEREGEEGTGGDGLVGLEFEEVLEEGTGGGEDDTVGGELERRRPPPAAAPLAADADDEAGVAEVVLVPGRLQAGQELAREAGGH